MLARAPARSNAPPTLRTSRGPGAIARVRRRGRSVVDYFEPLFAERREGQRIDEVDDLAQRRIDERAIAADLADAEFGALPQVVAVGFRDRHVELRAHAILDRAQHLALALERMVLGQEERKLQDPDNHDQDPYNRGEDRRRIRSADASRPRPARASLPRAASRACARPLPSRTPRSRRRA